MPGFMQIIEFRTSRLKEVEEPGRPSPTEGSTAPTFRVDDGEIGSRVVPGRGGNDAPDGAANR